MNPTQEEKDWQPISRVLFGGRKTADEGLFTYRVMERIRELTPAGQDLAWRRFLRWAIPLLGAGAASLVLSVRAPVSSLSMETVLFQRNTLQNDPLTPLLEGLR